VKGEVRVRVKVRVRGRVGVGKRVGVKVRSMRKEERRVRNWVQGQGCLRHLVWAHIQQRTRDLYRRRTKH